MTTSPGPMVPSPMEEVIVQTLRVAGCVFAEDEAILLCAAATDATDLARMVEQRVAGLPLEHIVGWAEFCGLRIVVEAGVFVPRRRTEHLAEQARTRTSPRSVVLDLCCGAAPVGTVLLAALPSIELHAADIDPRAVRNARINIAGRGQVWEGDLDAPLPLSLASRVDVLVANAPYVPTEQIAFMPPEAREHEPTTALDGGIDGLDLHRRVAALAPRWLTPGGHLLIETSRHQAPDTLAIIKSNGFDVQVVRSDEHEATVIVGRLRESSPGHQAWSD